MKFDINQRLRKLLLSSVFVAFLLFTVIALRDILLIWVSDPDAVTKKYQMIERFAQYATIYIFFFAGMRILKYLLDYLGVPRDQDSGLPAQLQPLQRDRIRRTKDESEKRKEVFSEFLYVYEFYLEVRRRLNNEVFRLSQQANVNLVIGLMTSIAGIGILTYFVFSRGTESSDGIHPFFLERLALTLLIETFAFFFLRLYKGNLDEIKYYQNELTSIELKVLGIFLVMERYDKQAIADIATRLVQYERNAPIDKQKTTEELEKLKIEKSYFDRILSVFASSTKR